MKGYVHLPVLLCNTMVLKKKPKSSAKIYVVHVQNNVTNMIKLLAHSLHIILLCITNQ